MAEYRVNLEIYNGPLDLLLYLIRREEVDIYDIPIARIAEQYVGYVELFKQIDPNLAGEFLVMVATLMEIKTRMLLPAAGEPGADAEGLEVDPRAELVRQLLEYKAFKDAALDLAEAGQLQAMRHPRRPALPGRNGEETIDLEDVQIWDLMDAFNRLLASIGAQRRSGEVIYDDTPVELHAADIVDRLHRDGAMPFHRIFAGRNAREEIVGLFLALLELVRLRKVLVSQQRAFGEIFVQLNPNPPADDEPLEAPAAPAAAPSAAPADAGAAPPPEDQPHDDRGEAEGTGP